MEILLLAFDARRSTLDAILRIHGKNCSHDLGVMRNKHQLIIGKRCLSMKVCILREFEDSSRLVVIVKFYAEVQVYMSEPFNAAVFACGDDSSCLGEFGFSPANVLRVV